MGKRLGIKEGIAPISFRGRDGAGGVIQREVSLNEGGQPTSESGEGE